MKVLTTLSAITQIYLTTRACRTLPTLQSKRSQTQPITRSYTILMMKKIQRKSTLARSLKMMWTNSISLDLLKGKAKERCSLYLILCLKAASWTQEEKKLTWFMWRMELEVSTRIAHIVSLSRYHQVLVWACIADFSMCYSGSDHLFVRFWP